MVSPEYPEYPDRNTYGVPRIPEYRNNNQNNGEICFTLSGRIKKKTTKERNRVMNLLTSGLSETAQSAAHHPHRWASEAIAFAVRSSEETI
jgi:hypothetical protein